MDLNCARMDSESENPKIMEIIRKGKYQIRAKREEKKKKIEERLGANEVIWSSWIGTLITSIL